MVALKPPPFLYEMKKIEKTHIFPSAAFSVDDKQTLYYDKIDKKPDVGDIMYGRVISIGQHSSIENKNGRIHSLYDGIKSLFVFGNRYATDYYEATVPDELNNKADLIARSGLVGQVNYKSEKIKDPTKIKILGYVCNKNKKIINTKDYSQKIPKKKSTLKSKMILSVGSDMNSGKTTTATSCCWALSNMGYKVYASKITGTASLKDILHMQDAGADKITDFTYFGYPSTYLLNKKELINLFNKFVDFNKGTNINWVVEFADGILQRETSYLLLDKSVRSKIGKLIFNAADAFSAIGGIKILKEKYNLVPDAISGVITGSPLSVKEVQEYIDIPIINNMNKNLKEIAEVIL